MPDVPPLRSLLFVPGSRADRVAKALAGPADAVIIDLEAAITRHEAPRARAIVRDALDGHGAGDGHLLVRVSGVDEDDFPLDLEAAVHPRLCAVVLPQVSGVDDVRRADAALAALEADRGLQPGSIALLPLLETAGSVRAAWEIATSAARIAYLGVATARGGDLARSIGYRWTPAGHETLFLRSKVLLDVRAAGVANPTCGVWADIADLDGLRRYAEECQDLGYEGLLVIHPSHVPVVNDVFTPTADEIAEWQEVLDAMAEAEAAGAGAIRVRGQLVDAAHVATARQQLDRAERLGLNRS
jgi:citrate lyase subunit beta / citryl-CoA lyase